VEEASSRKARAEKTIHLTPNIQHQPRALFEKLELGGALYSGRSTLRLTKNPCEGIFDLLGHVLGLTADVDVALAIENGVRNVFPIVPDEVLDVDLAAVGLILLTGEGVVHDEFALEFLDVFWPFILVQEVLGGFAATVEERDGSPVCERIGSVLLNRAAGKGNTFLNETTERSDTLKITTSQEIVYILITSQTENSRYRDQS
jgi:hypothetical protein